MTKSLMTKSLMTKSHARYRIRKALAVKAERWGTEIVDVIAVCKDGKIVLYDPDTGDKL